MDPKGVQRVQDTRRNELVVEEVAKEGRYSVLVVVVAMEAVDQAVIHIDMENCMAGKSCSEKVIVELGVVEHLDKVMNVVAVE